MVCTCSLRFSRGQTQCSTTMGSCDHARLRHMGQTYVARNDALCARDFVHDGWCAPARAAGNCGSKLQHLNSAITAVLHLGRRNAQSFRLPTSLMQMQT